MTEKVIKKIACISITLNEKVLKELLEYIKEDADEKVLLEVRVT